MTIDPAVLVAAMEKAGWTRVGERAGKYVRLRWQPESRWYLDATVLVPLDATAPDYADLLEAVLRSLEILDQRGQAARQVLHSLT